MLGTLHGGEVPGKLSPDYADRIYLTPDFDKSHDDYRSHVLIHELAHFVGPTGQTGVQVDDYGYRHKPGYDALVPWQRVHNADNFAQFSFDAVGKPFNLKEHLIS